MAYSVMKGYRQQPNEGKSLYVSANEERAYTVSPNAYDALYPPLSSPDRKFYPAPTVITVGLIKPLQRRVENYVTMKDFVDIQEPKSPNEVTRKVAEKSFGWKRVTRVLFFTFVSFKILGLLTGCLNPAEGAMNLSLLPTNAPTSTADFSNVIFQSAKSSEQSDVDRESIPTITPRPTSTIPPTKTPKSTKTPFPTRTVRPTSTTKPTNTPRPTPTNTPEPTATLIPIETLKPVDTPVPIAPIVTQIPNAEITTQKEEGSIYLFENAPLFFNVIASDNRPDLRKSAQNIYDRIPASLERIRARHNVAVPSQEQFLVANLSSNMQGISAYLNDAFTAMSKDAFRMAGPEEGYVASNYPYLLLLWSPGYRGASDSLLDHELTHCIQAAKVMETAGVTLAYLYDLDVYKSISWPHHSIYGMFFEAFASGYNDRDLSQGYDGVNRLNKLRRSMKTSNTEWTDEGIENLVVAAGYGDMNALNAIIDSIGGMENFAKIFTSYVRILPTPTPTP